MAAAAEAVHSKLGARRGVNGGEARRRRRAPGKSLARGRVRGRARVLSAPRGAERPNPGQGVPGGGPAGRRDAAAPEEVVQSPPGSRCCVRCVPRSRQGPVPMSAGLFAGLGIAVRDGKGAESKI